MAVTLTITQLLASMRLGDSAEELAEATRLLDYSTEAVTHYAPDAPNTAQNEAVIRLASQMFDQPTATRGAYSNAMRNSGAARILMPYRIHRAGSTEDAIAVAQGAIGTPGNPVVDVDISAGELVITFNDGTTETHTLPSAGTFGIDQTARDSADTAQTAADTAQTAAGTAQTAADTAQTEIDDHETNHPSGGTTDQTARDAAESNTTALADKMERSDVSAGVGISVLADTGSTTGLTISITGSSEGPEELSGGQWRFDYNTQPPEGRVFYNGNTTPLEWVFATGGAFNSAQAELLALVARDEIEIKQSATRFQLITLTATPTLSGDNVTVTGTTPPRLNHERPENNAAVTVTLIPGPIQGVDQVARDAAGEAEATADAAQTDITDHETNHPSAGTGIDQTARDAATAAQGTADANAVTQTTHDTDPNAHHVPPTGGGAGPDR